MRSANLLINRMLGLWLRFPETVGLALLRRLTTANFKPFKIDHRVERGGQRARGPLGGLIGGCSRLIIVWVVVHTHEFLAVLVEADLVLVQFLGVV